MNKFVKQEEKSSKHYKLCNLVEVDKVDFAVGVLLLAQMLSFFKGELITLICVRAYVPRTSTYFHL